MPTPAQNEFAARMASKPLPASLNSDPEHRLFFDPPELIQRAFDGRPWFLETGCTTAFRVGLFRGLGWKIPGIVAQQDERGIDTVRITARPRRNDATDLIFDMEFLQTEQPPEDYASGKIAARVVEHHPGLTIDQLKPTYGEVLGEHAL